MLRFSEAYKYISFNEKLSQERHPLLEQNKFMKFFIYIFASFWAIYLMFLGFALGQIDNLNYEIFDILDGYMILFLVLDFIVRLTIQDIPAQKAKLYKLIPIRQKHVILVFLIKMSLSLYNMFWMFFWIPFSFFTIFKYYGFGGFLLFNIGWTLIYILNGLWFLIWRTKAQSNAFYYFIPFTIYALLSYLGVFADFSSKWLFNACLLLGRSFCEFHIFGFVIVLILIILLFLTNFKHQSKYVYNEISKNDELKKVKSSKMIWLNRFGLIGEFIKLEVKSTKRNKVVKKSFLMGLLCVLIFSLLFAFTDLYDNSQFMETFICVYCFACLGTITLTSILSAEGNFMDFLNSRKESIFYLLKAKYYYNCFLLLIPFVFALLPVFKGKFMFVEILGCMFFVSGCVFPFLFQQAVYNKTTIPLNEQVIKQGNNSKTQMFVSLVALFVPMIIMNILFIIFDNRFIPSIIMLIIGLTGTFSNGFWIKNIYRRFMNRRYANLDGFRSTRR